MSGIKKNRYNRIIIFVVLLFLLPVIISAQSSLTFSVSPLYSMPLGSSVDLYQYGIGGDFQVKNSLPLDGLDVFGNLQYQNTALQAGAGNLSLLLIGGGVTYIPFKAGIFSAGISAGGIYY